jgi:DNA-binding MarR family transcriptional regulator
MDLRARFPQPKPRSGKALTPAAQSLLLYHLQRHPLEGVPLKQIAATIGYSPIMLSHVKDELENAGLCVAERQGRAITLSFRKQGRELWDQAQSALSSPVHKEFLVRGQLPPSGILLAGISALSLRTDLQADRLPSYAIDADVLKTDSTLGKFEVGVDEDEATARLECWRYDPGILGEDTSVDPLSLYLSLRHSPDERVQQQLEQVLRQIQW